MAANVFLSHIPETGTPSAMFGYPTDAYVLKAQSNDGEVHIIWAYDETDPATNLANAPNGSLLITNVKLWRKSGDFGKKDGTWAHYGAGT